MNTYRTKSAKELETELNATGFFCDVEGEAGEGMSVTIHDIHEADIAGLVKYLKTADETIYSELAQDSDAIHRLLLAERVKMLAAIADFNEVQI